MSVPIKLRDDFSAADVRAHARRCQYGAQVRRLLAIATILDGGNRSDAAVIGGATRQIVRDWVVRFNPDGREGLATRKAPGPQTILNDGHRRALKAIIEAGSIPAAHGVVRWRIPVPDPVALAVSAPLRWQSIASSNTIEHPARSIGSSWSPSRSSRRGAAPQACVGLRGLAQSLDPSVWLLVSSKKDVPRVRSVRQIARHQGPRFATSASAIRSVSP